MNVGHWHRKPSGFEELPDKQKRQFLCICLSIYKYFFHHHMQQKYILLDNITIVRIISSRLISDPFPNSLQLLKESRNKYNFFILRKNI